MLPVLGKRGHNVQIYPGLYIWQSVGGVGGWHGSALIGHWLWRQRARSFLVWRIALNIQAWQRFTFFTPVKRRYNEDDHRGGKKNSASGRFAGGIKKRKGKGGKEINCQTFPLLTLLFCLGQTDYLSKLFLKLLKRLMKYIYEYSTSVWEFCLCEFKVQTWSKRMCACQKKCQNTLISNENDFIKPHTMSLPSCWERLRC